MAVNHVDARTAALRRALERLTPVRADYQVAPVLESFNWNDCLAEAGEGRWYLVVFRSRRRVEADDRMLTEHDDAAYAEAMAESGGLLHYFRGEPDAGRHCVSFCLWVSRAEARRASELPLHRAAARIAPLTYETYGVELHTLVRDAAGSLRLEVPE